MASFVVPDGYEVSYHRMAGGRYAAHVMLPGGGGARIIHDSQELAASFAESVILSHASQAKAPANA